LPILHTEIQVDVPGGGKKIKEPEAQTVGLLTLFIHSITLLSADTETVSGFSSTH